VSGIPNWTKLQIHTLDLMTAVRSLSLAFYFKGNEEYAAKAPFIARLVSGSATR